MAWVGMRAYILAVVGVQIRSQCYSAVALWRTRMRSDEISKLSVIQCVHCMWMRSGPLNESALIITVDRCAMVWCGVV